MENIFDLERYPIADSNHPLTVELINKTKEELESIGCAVIPGFIKDDPELPEDPDTNPKNIPNPETSYQFVNRMGREFLENNTIAYELKKEKEAVPKPPAPDITDPQIP